MPNVPAQADVLPSPGYDWQEDRRGMCGLAAISAGLGLYLYGTIAVAVLDAGRGE